MRFEPRRTFASAQPFAARGTVGALPADLAFLEPFGIPRATLHAAAARAAWEGTDGRRALLAEGAVSEAFYYRALAWHLGVPFANAWPRPAKPLDLRGALAQGWSRLDGADPAWLIAPKTADIRRLVSARSLALAMPDIAITTPSHFAAAMCHRAQAQIARRASDAFPEMAPQLSAFRVLTAPTVTFIAVGIVTLLAGLACGSHVESDVLGLVFLAGLLFRLFVFGEGLLPSATPAEDDALADRSLPAYSVLIPLRDEAEMVPDLVAALAALDYPSAKREVLFLVEPDDPATRAALAAQRLPPGFRIVDLPPGTPRTKPRALNVGLFLASGELVTIYDAEDRPEPDQLRLAAARFADAPDRLACLQARLAIAHATGLLPALFAIEYAGLFDVFNVGLARRGLPIALGGTSNHFRTAALRAVGGWDAWNVTEDADLGLRLARFGYDIDMLASTTFEEAPERLGLWFKQRRRWTKGWMQTLIVLMRDLPDVVRDLGPKRALVVALLLTNLVTGPLLTPFFLALVTWHLVAEGLPTPHGPVAILEATLAFTVIVVGALGTLWQAWLGARRRGLSCWLALPAVLPYQLMIAAAAWGGIIDLVRRPHHWHKTPHGAAARRVRRRASAASPPA